MSVFQKRANFLCAYSTFLVPSLLLTLFALNSCDGIDEVMMSLYAYETVQLVQQETLHFISRSVSAKESGWLQDLGTDAGMCVHCTCPRSRDLKQHLTNTWASISQNVINKQLVIGKKRLHATMSAKGHHFEHLLNWNQLFSEPTHYTTGFLGATNSLLKKTRCFASFPSHLFKSRQSKSERIRKVEYACHFWKCADAVYQKLSKLDHACRNYSDLVNCVNKHHCFCLHCLHTEFSLS